MAEYKKWFYLFWTTLLIGAGGAVIAGLALQFVNGRIDFKSVADFFLYPLILFGYGMLVSVYAQLGFFAYLILNYMGNGVFPPKIWKYIQLVLSVLALLELIFLRTVVGGERSVLSDLILGIFYFVSRHYCVLFQSEKYKHLSLDSNPLFYDSYFNCGNYRRAPYRC